jgi:Protein of unknown function (DUF1592)/Protein of unknown function (DUF1588)/Protein of unknown function (DUF1587)/Protein of unknown function (DUF1585)/Protein of unknown function (DUF1595)
MLATRRAFAAAVVAVLTGAVAIHGQDAARPSPASSQALVNEYCAGCHNERLKRGDLVLSGLDAANPASNPVVWEKVIRKVRAGMMPPPAARRPDPATLEAFARSLEGGLDAAAAANPNPGRPALHRLNRSEYANPVRDLLGFEIDVAALLPPDDMTHGFDNIADSLTVSPTLMDSYIGAADAVSRLAIGDRNVAPRVETYRVPQTYTQKEHVEGTPLGTRGGIAVRHFFPADGEYVFGMTFYNYSGKVFGSLQEGEKIEVSVDGERVALLDTNLKIATDELRTPPIKVAAGPRMVSAAFLSQAQGPVLDFMMPFETALSNLAADVPGVTGMRHLTTLGIRGPTNVTGIADTPSRRRIFTCQPANPQGDTPCARTIVTSLVKRAFRRPAAAADVDYLMGLYQQTRTKQGDFEAGIRSALQGVLSDPEFVFRFERTPAGVKPGAAYQVSDLELATRLSYFLWSSSPDDTLLNLASERKLRQPGVLDQQVRRMLADARAEALAKNFASEWLHLRNLDDWHPDPYLFPDADRNLMNSMRRETELFFMNIVGENRSIFDMLTADYTFVDGRLARHYKIPSVVGNRFRRISIAEENRRGLLGQASILTVTSYPTRTSPVVRGKWILDNLLGAPPPQPPPEVPPLKENTGESKPLPLRARLQEHRNNPTCAACHATFDPIGFALENFDAVGALRINDNGDRIDASGQLADGTKIDGPIGLRQILLRHSDLFATTFAERLLTYALGRGVDASDMPVVRSIVRGAERDDNRFAAYVMGIVNSVPFQMRKADQAASDF